MGKWYCYVAIFATESLKLLDIFPILLEVRVLS